MKKKKRKKELHFPMEFNPGLAKYEPVLPLRKTNETIKDILIKNRKGLLYLLILVLIFLIGIYFIITNA
jgi:hypothetical protein